MVLQPDFKPGDRLSAEFINELVRALVQEGFVPQAFQDYGGAASFRPPQPTPREVTVRPSFTVPAYSAFCIRLSDPQAELDANTFRPRYYVEDVARGSGPVFTNGEVEIASGTDGTAIHMAEGEYHWIRATDNVVGHCGLDGTAAGLKTAFQGFISGGYSTINGQKCGYVTRVRNTPLLGITTSIIPTSGTGTVNVYTPTSTNWDTPTKTFAAYTKVTSIANNTPVLLFPVDFRWFAVRYC